MLGWIGWIGRGSREYLSRSAGESLEIPSGAETDIVAG
jgi:hypothetical protein